MPDSALVSASFRFDSSSTAVFVRYCVLILRARETCSKKQLRESQQRVASVASHAWPALTRTTRAPNHSRPIERRKTQSSLCVKYTGRMTGGRV